MIPLKSHRPLEANILAILILWLVLWNCFRLFQSLFIWDILTQYPAHVGPLYVALSGMVWVLVGLILIWAGWQRKVWAWGAVIGGSTSYIIWSLFDRLILQDPHGNETLFWIAFISFTILVVLLLFSSNLRDFYHDQ